MLREKFKVGPAGDGGATLSLQGGYEVFHADLSESKNAAKCSSCEFVVPGHGTADRPSGSLFLQDDMTTALAGLLKAKLLEGRGRLPRRKREAA